MVTNTILLPDHGDVLKRHSENFGIYSHRNYIKQGDSQERKRFVENAYTILGSITCWAYTIIQLLVTILLYSVQWRPLTSKRVRNFHGKVHRSGLERAF